MDTMMNSILLAFSATAIGIAGTMGLAIRQMSVARRRADQDERSALRLAERHEELMRRREQIRERRRIERRAQRHAAQIGRPAVRNGRSATAAPARLHS